MSESPPLAYESRMLIDGELVDAQDGRTYENLNPATEEVIGRVADATAADMGRAIGAARSRSPCPRARRRAS